MLSPLYFSWGTSLAMNIFLYLIFFGIGLWSAFFWVGRKQQSTERERLTHLLAVIDREFSVLRAEMLGQRSGIAEMERALGGRVEGMYTAIAERLITLSSVIECEQAEARANQAESMRVLTEATTRQLAEIRQSVTEQLHQAVEQQMQTSFQRVLEQFSSMQKAMGEVQAMTAQISDIKKIWGEDGGGGGGGRGAIAWYFRGYSST